MNQHEPRNRQATTVAVALEAHDAHPGQGGRHSLHLVLCAALMLSIATIALLRRFEYQLPQWLAEQPPKADAVLVVKSERRLYLLRDGVPYRSWRVSLGRNPVGDKQREGDLRTPEGQYILDWRNPGSCCYRSLHVSYPDAHDITAAGERGDDPGGLIMIHGQVNGWGWLGWLMQYVDHTHGCIVVRNVPMEVIWRAVDDGTPIEIRP
jgi:murein L,D-transpeptidase YafK